jgi:hypothetical protein
MANRYCDSCNNGIGEYHITMTTDVFGGSAQQPLRRKVAQFWLCSACELLSRNNLARDYMQKGRLARLITQELDDSEYAGWWQDNGKMYGSAK